MTDDAICLVKAVDSCGGIGDKGVDALYCSLETDGFYTARVALHEVLASGANPVMATVAVCNEPVTPKSCLTVRLRRLLDFAT